VAVVEVNLCPGEHKPYVMPSILPIEVKHQGQICPLLFGFPNQLQYITT